MPKVFNLLDYKPTNYYPTYFLPEIDEAMAGGFKSKSLNILTGDTGLGKSMMACNIAFHQALRGVRVLFISTEMQPEDILPRLYAIVAGKNTRNYEFIQGVDNTASINEAQELMQPVYEKLELMFEKDIDVITAYIYENQQNYDVVILDHVHCLFSGMRLNLREDDFDKYVIRELEKLWTAGLCIIAVAQPRKSTQNMRDILGDKENIRGTFHWSYLASQILYLCETEKQSKHNKEDREMGQPEFVTLSLSKQRVKGQGTRQNHILAVYKWKSKYEYVREFRND